ncbi:MAG: hypothetical protein IIU01_05175 [Oscillospiraceae bacterium]|nr:hypothetical protein [Oscillospiraceae bacterium]
MQYLGYIFGIFGLMAYLQLSSLKGRVADLEEALTKLKGTSFHDDRKALVQAAKSYVGQKVTLELKEDQQNVDIVMYGNSKHGSNTILDADDDWLAVHVATPKGEKDLLIRMQSIERISVVKT